MFCCVLSRFILLVIGILYPAYASHKAVKTKNVKEYVRWMIYWIVFALFTFVEIFADVIIAFWFPFYYECKILTILWLTCPITKGSHFIYKKIIHPQLSKYEHLLDAYIESVWDHSYNLTRQISAQALDYVVQVLLELLQKGQMKVATFVPKHFENAHSVTQEKNNPITYASTENELNYNLEIHEDFEDVPFEVVESDTNNQEQILVYRKNSNHDSFDSDVSLNEPPAFENDPTLSTKKKLKGKRKVIN